MAHPAPVTRQTIGRLSPAENARPYEARTRALARSAMATALAPGAGLRVRVRVTIARHGHAGPPSTCRASDVQRRRSSLRPPASMPPSDENAGRACAGPPRHGDVDAALLGVDHVIEAQEMARSPTNPRSSIVVGIGLDLPGEVLTGRDRKQEPIPRCFIREPGDTGRSPLADRIFRDRFLPKRHGVIHSTTRQRHSEKAHWRQRIHGTTTQPSTTVELPSTSVTRTPTLSWSPVMRSGTPRSSSRANPRRRRYLPYGSATAAPSQKELENAEDPGCVLPGGSDP